MMAINGGIGYCGHSFKVNIPKPGKGLLGYKRASLAWAARLADTSCPPEAPFGRLEVTLVNYKGDNISKYVHLSVIKTYFPRKITKFVNFKIFDA